MHREGAPFLGYQGADGGQHQEAGGDAPGVSVVCCDVTYDEQIDAAFARKREAGVHVLVHSPAALTEALQGATWTRREAFRTTLEVSAYSLARALEGRRR
jgi:enoyl-[acyl-carrier-protein] reductase (NADH)